MSDYLKPIETLAEFDAIDEDACLEGYRAGLGFIAVNYMRKDVSYWHGYRNGQVDRGLEPCSREQTELVHQIVARSRAH